MKNFSIKANYIILIFILASYLTTSFNVVIVKTNITTDSFYFDESNKFENGDNSIITNNIEINTPQLSQYDKNSNDNITFIIQFPDKYDYSASISFFKSYGGIVKYEYDAAINGFSGIINSNNFSFFCEQLEQANIPYYIKEDSKVNANLYYTSRNMNLRPYVWNDLNGGYDGDDTSSIAILDTGIDDSHIFFPGGYGDKDFSRKIVGWNDTFSGTPLTTPRDRNGHGTHVAGIAAGDGSPELDHIGRTVGTSGLNLDLVGQLESPLLDGYYYSITVARFNVTNEGMLEIECEYTDSTSSDNMYGGIHLYHGNTEVNSTDPYIYLNLDLNLTYQVGANEAGVYELEFRWYPEDNTGDGGVLNPDSKLRCIIHYPFDPPLFGCGDPWKGVAPDTHIVGVKVLSSSGGGDASDIINGVDWVIDHKNDYNITIMSLSLGTTDGSSDEFLVDAVNNAVEAGIVTVVAAGNLGSGGDTIGSPGDAEKVITVAAMNNNDQITTYSSQGGFSYYSTTRKPDITAPGGSTNDFTMFSADSNDWDVDGAYDTDSFYDDLYSAQGTSMATPVVAGAASLLIEAMGGRPNWQYTEDQALLVKSLLLMTATETVNWREEDIAFSPTLDRGTKDIHEGYGRINIDAAIEAWINNLTDLVKSSGNINPSLNTSQFNPYGKHAYGGFVNLVQGIEYTFNLTVPSGVDYDLYVYNETPNVYGEPDLIVAGITPIAGIDEIFNYTADYTGKYFVIAKAIGVPLSLDVGDDDDDDDEVVELFDIIEFLTSPVGLLIIGLVAIVAIITILAIRASRNRNKYGIESIRRYSDDYNF